MDTCGLCLFVWVQFLLVMHYLSEMTDDQTLVMYSGHPLGLFPSLPSSPRAIITNGMVTAQNTELNNSLSTSFAAYWCIRCVSASLRLFQIIPPESSMKRCSLWAFQCKLLNQYLLYILQPVCRCLTWPVYILCIYSYGQMTAGSYCYIGPQGIVHGTMVCQNTQHPVPYSMSTYKDGLLQTRVS